MATLRSYPPSGPTPVMRRKRGLPDRDAKFTDRIGRVEPLGRLGLLRVQQVARPKSVQGIAGIHGGERERIKCLAGMSASQETPVPGPPRAHVDPRCSTLKDGIASQPGQPAGKTSSRTDRWETANGAQRALANSDLLAGTSGTVESWPSRDRVRPSSSSFHRRWRSTMHGRSPTRAIADLCGGNSRRHSGCRVSFVEQPGTNPDRVCASGQPVSSLRELQTTRGHNPRGRIYCEQRP